MTRMVNEKAGISLVNKAYKLETPADNVDYYRDVASTYDADFADGTGYRLPDTVVARYRQLAAPIDVPVADIGCGTGLIADALDDTTLVVDGMDISPEMLAAAGHKGRYRRLQTIDLTRSLETLASNYGAVLSAGTFTHGHLGPDALVALLAIARTGALFIIGVNAQHFGKLGFERTVGALLARALITQYDTTRVPIYDKTGHSHSNDHAVLLSFRKC